LAPVLAGGFGNMLYQMATVYSIAKEINSTCLIAWWDQSLNKGKYSPFDGRPPPAPGITLKHIFPNIRYVDFYPAPRQVLNSKTCPSWLPDETRYIPFPPSLRRINKIWIRGPFVDWHCLFMRSISSHI
jgi:hypothetical protein